MPDEERPDEEMELLSRAIIDAIVKSKDVRNAMNKLFQADESYAKSLMVLMLKVQNLADSLGTEGENGTEFTHEKRLEFNTKVEEELRNHDIDISNIVDGIRETSSETAFRKFLADRFDQDEWLKKNGLIL